MLPFHLEICVFALHVYFYAALCSFVVDRHDNKPDPANDVRVLPDWRLGEIRTISPQRDLGRTVVDSYRLEGTRTLSPQSRLDEGNCGDYRENLKKQYESMRPVKS